MTVIEKLQLIYRKLKKKPEAKAIGELCKTIITVEQLTNALEDLFIDGWYLWDIVILGNT